MPSSTGISMSSVTMSGSRACTFFRASSPLRAAPTTRNSPDASITSATSFRMKALSSTTSTVRAAPLEDDIALHHGFHDHLARGYVEVHAPPVRAAHVLGEDGDARAGERGAGGHQV